MADYGMCGTYDVANCRHSASGNSPHTPNFGSMIKKRIFAEQKNHDNEQTARLYVYSEISFPDGIVHCCVLNPVPSSLLAVLIDLLVLIQGELQTYWNNNHVRILCAVPSVQ